MNSDDTGLWSLGLLQSRVNLNKVARQAVRILSLGHAEATVRSSLAARLDVLTEVSAAVCDLFAEEPSSDQFQLMHFDVHCGAELSRSTLASFDAKIGSRLKRDFGPRIKVDVKTGNEHSADYQAKPGEWVLTLPEMCRKALFLLRPHWKEWIRDFDLDGRTKYPTWTTPEGQPTATAEERDEFHDSLRHAFDVINDDLPESSFTLEIDHATAPYFVTDDKKHNVNFSLGYCIPSSRVEDIMARLDHAHPAHACGCGVDDHNGLKLLETIRRPADGMPFRSQPHTNVRTRLASLVRNQHVRDRNLPTPGRYALAGHGGNGGGLDHTHFEALQTAVWGTPPSTIFLMPLTNQAFLSGATTAQTLALWYVIPQKSESLERLFYRRYRASQLFSECLYERYCKALGRCLARHIVRGRTDPILLKNACARIAFTYRLPMSFDVEHATTPDTSLHDAMARVRRTETGSRKAEWSPTLEGNLRSVAIRFMPQQLRPTFRTDLLLRIQRALETETPRFHGGNLNTAIERFSDDLDFLRRTVVDSERLQRSLRVAFDRLSQDVGLPSVRWARLSNLRDLYHGAWATCKPCERRSRQVSFGGWTFQSGHDICVPSTPLCKICHEELRRRLAFLVGASPENPQPAQATTDFQVGSAEQRSHTLLWSLPDPWNWVKRACSASTDGATSVSTSAIVVLLMLQGVGVELHRELLTKRLLGLPPQWQSGLAGIGLLARSEQRNLEQDRSADIEHAVKISVEKRRITFLLQGLHYDRWFERQRDAAMLLPPGEGNSRKVAIAAALMPSRVDVRLSASPDVARIKVDLVSGVDALSISWPIEASGLLPECE